MESQKIMANVPEFSNTQKIYAHCLYENIIDQLGDYVNYINEVIDVHLIHKAVQ